MTYRKNFTYTGSKTDFDSSAIAEAYYNADTQELAVVVTGGSGYVYKNVPSYVWNYFTNATSAGNYYATTLKTQYGPGEYLGYFNDGDVDFFRYFLKDDSDDNLITLPNFLKNEGANLYVFPSSESANPAPSTVNVYNNTYSLSSESVKAENKYKHVLRFKISGQDTVREHTLQAKNLEDAIDQLAEIANMLDLVFEITSATVVFSE